MSTTNVDRGNGLRYLYSLAAFVIVIAGLRAAETIVNPLLLSIFLAVISAPVYFSLIKRGLADWVALLIVIAGLCAVAAGLLVFVAGSVSSFTERQGHYRALIAERKREIQHHLEDLFPKPEQEDDSVDGASDDEDSDVDGETFSPVTPDEQSESSNGASDEPGSETVASSDLLSTVSDEPDSGEDDSDSDSQPAADGSDDDGSLDQSAETDEAANDTLPATKDDEAPQSLTDLIYSQFDPGTAISLVANLASSLGNLLSKAFLILLTVIFILLEVSTFRTKVNLAFERNAETTNRAQQIIQSIQRYIAIKTMMSLLTGVLVAVWLVVLGVPHAGLWGLIAFLLNYIPNVGSVIAAVPAVMIAWLELGNMPALATAIGYLVVNTVVGNFLEPRLMGKGLGLSVLVIFCSMVFWGWVLGPVGMLLSVPLTMTARIALEGFDDTKWIAIFMSGVERES